MLPEQMEYDTLLDTVLDYALDHKERAECLYNLIEVLKAKREAEKELSQQ